MATQLSVNVNKVATLRNSRGGSVPRLLDAVQTILDAGCKGITVHPRADERHITKADVLEIAEALHPHRETVEYNIEGDPRADLMDLVCSMRPHQCTLVPVRPGEITSEAGWEPGVSDELVSATVKRLHAAGVRVSLFTNPDLRVIDWAASMGADRVELYTEPFASAFAESEQSGLTSFERFARAAEHAHMRGLGVNAGHDLDLENLVLFKKLPHLAEVSIGHALISRALFCGLASVVTEYLQALE